MWTNRTILMSSATVACGSIRHAEKRRIGEKFGLKTWERENERKFLGYE